MTRRVTLPGADELFRATGTDGPEAAAVDLVAPRPLGVAPGPPSSAGDEATEAGASSTPTDGSRPPGRSPRTKAGVRRTARPRAREAVGQRQPSGRERHEEKITVYLSPDELVDLEAARLELRQRHGMAVDRGRIVREALAIVLADLDARGDTSTLVRRLQDG